MFYIETSPIMKKNIFSFILIVAAYYLVHSCTKESYDSPLNNGTSGIGGSMARFTITGDFLYTVNDSELKSFNIADPSSPVYQNSKYLGFGIETIFPYKNHLFIGTVTGMEIYNIDIPSSPSHVSTYSHVYSCDPVAVDSNYAYVTLHSEDSWCGRSSNELHVINIANLNSIYQAKIYPMTNPRGLGVDERKLFICDNGLKVYDTSNPLNLKLLNHFEIKAQDVIPHNNLLIVTGEEGIYQYKYSNDSIILLSKILIDSNES